MYDQRAIEYYNQGIDYYNPGQNNEVIVPFDIALKIDPASSEAWFNRGKSPGLPGRYDDAIVSFDTLLEINPDDSVAQQNRKLALQLKKQKTGFFIPGVKVAGVSHLHRE